MRIGPKNGDSMKIYLLPLAALLAAPTVSAAVFQTYGSETAAGPRTYETEATLDDLSVANSPLRATGKASFRVVISTNTKSVTCSLQGNLTNVSSKAVVAFEARLDIASERGGCVHWDYKVDYIFNRNMLDAGSSYDLTEVFGPVETSHRGSFLVGKAEVNVNVIFVQFSDGSSFGKSDWSEQLSSQRRSKIELMKSLSKAFDDGDAPALAKTVDDRLAQGGEPTFAWSVLYETKQHLQEKGASATVEEIHQRLATVAERSKLIGPP
jgi:hypothetical protein